MTRDHKSAKPKTSRFDPYDALKVHHVSFNLNDHFDILRKSLITLFSGLISLINHTSIKIEYRISEVSDQDDSPPYPYTVFQPR